MVDILAVVDIGAFVNTTVAETWSTLEQPIGKCNQEKYNIQLVPLVLTCGFGLFAPGLSTLVSTILSFPSFLASTSAPGTYFINLVSSNSNIPTLASDQSLCFITYQWICQLT